MATWILFWTYHSKSLGSLNKRGFNSSQTLGSSKGALVAAIQGKLECWELCWQVASRECVLLLFLFWKMVPLSPFLWGI